MDKEEYIFLNKKYENAVTAIKAQLFDVISNEEKKAMRIGLEMSREGISEEKYKQLQELAMKQGEDLGRVITLTSKLSDTLVRLDSYTKILRELRKEKASTEEVEKNVQATAAEVVMSINETDVSQQTKDKVIENVGVIAEVAQVEVPEVAVAKAASSENSAVALPTESVNETVPVTQVEVPNVDAPVVEAQSVADATPVVPAPVVEAQPIADATPVVEDQPVADATPAVDAPVVEAQPVADATPVVETAPIAPVVSETPAPVVEATPVTDVTPEPLIPVEEAKTEEVVAPAPVVEAQPAPDTTGPLIPVEEVKTEEVVAPAPVVEAQLAPDTTGPLIPVEEVKTEEVVASAPAVEAQPAVETSGPLIPVEEVKTEEVVATPALAVEAQPVVDTTGPLIPITTENVGTAIVDEALAQESTANETVQSGTTDTSDEVPLIPLPDEVGIAEQKVAEPQPAEGQVTPSEDVKVNTPEVAQNVVLDKLTFTKNDKLKAKALLTTSKQISNLRKSLSTQEALYGSRVSNSTNASLEDKLIENGLLPADVDTMKKQVEQLMEQANALYKGGKTTEAQAMYDKISALNKEIQAKSNNSLSV